MSETQSATVSGSDWVAHLTARTTRTAARGAGARRRLARPDPGRRRRRTRPRETPALAVHRGIRRWTGTVRPSPGRRTGGGAGGPDLPEAQVAKTRGKAFAAACSVVIIASPDPTSNVPVWEQVSSASCTGYAIVLAATGLGFGAVWKSAAVLDTAPVRELFELGPEERLLGWVNIGTPQPPRHTHG